MKTTKLLFVSIICLLALTTTVSCKKQNKTSTDNAMTTKTTGDNSQNSLDWDGIYSGVVPCADCEGIQTTIILKRDNTYEMRTKYLGKDNNEILQKDKFEWNKAGNEITLFGIEENSAPSKYLVGENKLVQLDMNSSRMASDVEPKYTIIKVSDVLEKYWKLIEVNGKEVAASESQVREPHFILKIENNRVNGNGSCNSFHGTYVIENGNRIKFSQMASTMMACLNMDTETQFMRALNTADSYTVKGDTLSLNRARMAPLARFAAVYMD